MSIVKGLLIIVILILSISIVQALCTETDTGDDSTNYGTCTLNWGTDITPQTGTDQCKENQLWECICSGDDFYYKIYNCDCKSGECKDIQNEKYYYYTGSKLVAQKTEQGLNYIHNDHLGSASVVTDTTGNIITEQKYNPFGTQLIESDQTFSYTGKEQDKTRLYYYGARYYDSNIGRFTSIDPIADGINRYIYVRNNPMMFVDPKGLEFTVPESYGDYGGQLYPDIGHDIASQFNNDLFSGQDVVGFDGNQLTIQRYIQFRKKETRAVYSFLLDAITDNSYSVDLMIVEDYGSQYNHEANLITVSIADLSTYRMGGKGKEIDFYFTPVLVHEMLHAHKAHNTNDYSDFSTHGERLAVSMQNNARRAMGLKNNRIFYSILTEAKTSRTPKGMTLSTSQSSSTQNEMSETIQYGILPEAWDTASSNYFRSGKVGSFDQYLQPQDKIPLSK